MTAFGKRVLAIVPARGGSKGITLKNIKQLNGIPLINYTLNTALKCNLIDNIVVSTDHPEISDIALSSGVKVVHRPAEYAQDTSPTEDALTMPILALVNDYKSPLF